MRVTLGGQSFSSISDASDDERGLSKYAAEQIFKHIVKPILREQSLKEFHDLIKTVPERIGDKEIKNLRDLEKTLIFLAPVSSNVGFVDSAIAYGCSGVKDYSRSPSKYLRFCERTIRVLHTTVTTLHESDQRAPTDRPYTQGYFFELVEQVRAGVPALGGATIIDTLIQIRRYATILAITREKQARGEKLDAMDVTKYVFISSTIANVPMVNWCFGPLTFASYCQIHAAGTDLVIPVSNNVLFSLLLGEENTPSLFYPTAFLLRHCTITTSNTKPQAETLCTHFFVLWDMALTSNILGTKRFRYMEASPAPVSQLNWYATLPTERSYLSQPAR